MMSVGDPACLRSSLPRKPNKAEAPAGLYFFFRCPHSEAILAVPLSSRLEQHPLEAETRLQPTQLSRPTQTEDAF